MQCRGEWKLARGDSNPGICVGATMRYGLHPLGDDLSCSRGLNEVIPTEKYVPRVWFPQGIILLRGLTIPAETIFWGCGYRGYRYAQPTAKHGLSPVGDRLHVRIACVAGDLPVAPTATRCNPGAFFIGVIPTYFVDLQYAM